MIILLDWPITVGHHWSPELITIQTAGSKQKRTISKPISGTTLLIILFRKYLFMILAFLIDSSTFRSKFVIGYSVAATNQAAFFIGGRYESSVISSVIAKYENDEWSLHGNLHKRRLAHWSITSGTETLIIGGKTNDGS